MTKTPTSTVGRVGILFRALGLAVALALWLSFPAWGQDDDGGAPEGDGATPPSEPDGTEPPATPAPEPEEPIPGVALTVEPPRRSNGLSLLVSWPAAEASAGLALLRAEDPAGPWKVVADDLPAAAGEHEDSLSTDPRIDRPPEAAYYKLAFKDPGLARLKKEVDAAQLIVMAGGGEVPEAATDRLRAAEESYVAGLLARSSAVAMGVPSDSWFNVARWPLLALIVLMGALILHFTRQARMGKDIFIRRIPGVDAIEEAVGRATEMGKPVLYIPGIGEFQEIQTIASLLILGRVAEIVASYDSDVIVTCTYPIVREVADEAVRQGYFQAGRPDAYKPFNVRFISSEQFAFTASTNGIILREKPAANIYLGQFFAESLILAETGFVNQSIQIAGTAETSQIPFFVTACDYTLIGEELYAVSAYLTREPRLTSSLKASDWVRLALIVVLILGTLDMTLFHGAIRDILLMH